MNDRSEERSQEGEKTQTKTTDGRGECVCDVTKVGRTQRHGRMTMCTATGIVLLPLGAITLKSNLIAANLSRMAIDDGHSSNPASSVHLLPSQ